MGGNVGGKGQIDSVFITFLPEAQEGTLFLLLIFKDFIYLFLERGVGREK